MSSELSILIRGKLNFDVTLEDVVKDLKKLETEIKPIYVDVFVRDGVKGLEKLKVELAEIAQMQAKAVSDAIKNEKSLQNEQDKTSKKRQKNADDEAAKLARALEARKKLDAELRKTYALELDDVKDGTASKIGSTEIGNSKGQLIKSERYKYADRPTGVEIVSRDGLIESIKVVRNFKKLAEQSDELAIEALKKREQQIQKFAELNKEELFYAQDYDKKIRSYRVAQVGKEPVTRESVFNSKSNEFYDITKNSSGDVIGIKTITDMKRANALRKQMQEESMSESARAIAEEQKIEARRQKLENLKLKRREKEVAQFVNVNNERIKAVQQSVLISSEEVSGAGKRSTTKQTYVDPNSMNIYRVVKNDQNQITAIKIVQDMEKARRILEQQRRKNLTDEERALEDAQKLAEKRNNSLAEQLKAQRNAERDALRTRNLGSAVGDIVGTRAKFAKVPDMSDASIAKIVNKNFGKQFADGFKFDTSEIQRSFYATGQQIAKFSVLVKDADGQIRKIQLGISSTDNILRKHHSTVQKISTALATMTDKVKSMFKGLLAGYGATQVFYMITNAVKAGIAEIFAIDKAMTNLKKVTDETTSSYESFYFEANRIGNTLGKTTHEVVASTAEFARLGFNLQQAKNLAQEALLYSNVGDLPVEEASQVLVSTMKGFGMEMDTQAKNARRVVDMFNEIGNNYAISSAGIGSALKRSAASLHEAGNDIEESIGLIVSANSVIQDPEQVGKFRKFAA